MAEKRKADVFAGRGSLSDILKRQRMAIEDGDPSGGREMDTSVVIQEKEQPKPRDTTNSPSKVLERGYRIHKGDE